MAEILTIEHADWSLSVWTKDVTQHQQKLHHALKRRNPEATLSEQDFAVTGLVLGEQDQLDQPLFFENTQYDFDLWFKDGAKLDTSKVSPHIAHHYASIADAFHYKATKKLLSGSINFGNDIGQACLPLVYETQTGRKQIDLRFTVWSTKLDYQTDLDELLTAFNGEFADWSFALISATDHGFSRSNTKQHNFPLLWLAHFKSLWHELAQHTKVIVNAPHNRLLLVERWVKTERLTGKLSAKLEERVSEDINAQQYHKRYRVNTKQLSVDTPENRFIRFALQQVKKQLRQIESQVQAIKSDRISDYFFDDLKEWQHNIDQHLNYPLFKELGEFTGLSKESLVLQQRAGYSGFYRVWQALKLYLDVLGSDSFISLKSMDELYEVWCFLKIRDLLIDINFEQTQHDKAHLKEKNLEWQTQDGFGGAFHLSNKQGINIRLVHEKTFSKSTQPIRSLLVNQRPDIVLEATFSNGDQLIWLFDAKYRLNPRTKDEAIDQVPEDAINQMHRYRDALLYEQSEDSKLSRPVFGAFALYPAFVENPNKQKNPYQEGIDRIAIGAFPLLPCSNGDIWLKEFLSTKFSEDEHKPYSFYVEDSATIPTYGLKQTPITPYRLTTFDDNEAYKPSNKLP